MLWDSWVWAAAVKSRARTPARTRTGLRTFMDEPP